MARALVLAEQVVRVEVRSGMTEMMMKVLGVVRKLGVQEMPRGWRIPCHAVCVFSLVGEVVVS